MKELITAAVNALRPNASWSLRVGEENGQPTWELIWHDEIQTEPSRDEIASRMTPQFLLDLAKAEKVDEINRDCDATVEKIKATYPETEVLSWPKQEAEARAFIADPSTDTPLLTAISISRGVALSELASRVVAKSTIFASISGALFGKRQLLEAQINAATSLEEVEAVKW